MNRNNLLLCLIIISILFVGFTTSDSQIIDALTKRIEALEALQIENHLNSLETDLSELKKPDNALITSKQARPLVTFIDDDGSTTILSKLKPISEEKGVAFVIALPSSHPISKNDVLYLQNNLKWEVASHGDTHIPISILPTEADIWNELSNSYNKLTKEGFNVHSIVYPYGYNDDRTRRLSEKLYNCGVTTDDFLNISPLKTFSLGRVPFGSNTINGQNTFSYYKSKVDDAINRKGWLIFMLHCADPNHDETQQNNLRNIIDYCKSKNVDVVTLQDGLSIRGNLLELGDKSTKHLVVGSDGQFESDIGNFVYKPLDWIGATDTVTKLDINTTYVTTIYQKTSGFPNNSTGVLTTVVPESKTQSYQTFVSGTRVYRRSINGDLTGWNPWYSSFTGENKTININHGTIPANSYKVYKPVISNYFSTNHLILSPKTPLPDGVIFSYQYNTDWEVKLTIVNLTNNDINLGTLTWTYYKTIDLK